MINFNRIELARVIGIYSQIPNFGALLFKELFWIRKFDFKILGDLFFFFALPPPSPY